MRDPDGAPDGMLEMEREDPIEGFALMTAFLEWAEVFLDGIPSSLYKEVPNV